MGVGAGGIAPRLPGLIRAKRHCGTAATFFASQRLGVMVFSRRSGCLLSIACLGSLTTTALVAGPAAAAPASAAIAGASAEAGLAFQVPADYRQQGSLTNGGPD